MSAYHQFYMSPVQFDLPPVTVALDVLASVFTDLGVDVPEDKDRYWLMIPYPGYDYRLSWDGGTTFITVTDDYYTTAQNGIYRDVEVHAAVDADKSTAPDLVYYLLLPWFNRILS